jgi:hypothetical protein
MNESGGSRKVRKTGSTEVSLRPKVESPKSEEDNNTAPDSYRDDLPQSNIESLQTANSKLQIESMEVHHHPEVEKKGFKEYLLEGLMIFIAVMMGFFAESLREHISENKRAKEYATTLYSDLKADTIGLDKYLKRINFGAANVDTLMKLLSANDPKDIPSGKLYWYGLFGGMQLGFAPHDATLLEMKNSGSLRFLKPAISRMVAEYDQRLQFFKSDEQNELGIYTEVRKTKALLFNFKYNDAANIVVQRIYLRYSRAPIDSFIKTNPPLLSTDKIIFNQFVELVRSRFLKNQATYADSLNHHAIVLIRALKKEYNLEDE